MEAIDMTAARHLIIPLCPHLQEELVTIKVSSVVSQISCKIIWGSFSVSYVKLDLYLVPAA